MRLQGNVAFLVTTTNDNEKFCIVVHPSILNFLSRNGQYGSRSEGDLITILSSSTYYQIHNRELNECVANKKELSVNQMLVTNGKISVKINQN